ncbi:MAG: tyrosine--tRNA ligase [Candidatus Micrarchaeota archaeon]|nr:tyrosine--tRNA ligase [Candidatus Micrarchaeota archaeon]
MDVETALDMIKSEPTEEIVTEDELRSLLESNSHPTHYIGLEISGMLHLGHLLVGGKKINDFAKAGAKTNILLADWHSMANNKMGGDWERILKAAEFYKKVFGIFCPDAKITLGSELYRNNDEYWKTVMLMARKTTMARATRTLIIQGRSEKDTLHVSQYIYPIMQAADINELDVDIPHAGIDQRRINVLAKEMFSDMGFKKVVPVHHHLLQSLAEPPKDMPKGTKEEIVAAMKMSKSKPGSAIPIIATDEEIAKTMKSAWCPVKVTEENPVLELCRYVIFPISSKLKIERKKEYGGDMEYESYKELEKDYAAGKLHPVDLKNAVSASIISMLEPVRRGIKGHRELLEVFKEN